MRWCTWLRPRARRRRIELILRPASGRAATDLKKIETIPPISVINRPFICLGLGFSLGALSLLASIGEPSVNSGEPSTPTRPWELSEAWEESSPHLTFLAPAYWRLA